VSSKKQYDVFFSYARSERGFSSRVAKDLQQSIQQKTGRQLEIFFDRKSILTAENWRESIHSGLAE
jgi:hypothetical protein